MKKKSILIGFITLFLAVGLTGCTRGLNGKGETFQLSVKEFATYAYNELFTLSEETYENFMHASYLTVIDYYGEVHVMKISAEIERHPWDFSRLDDNDTFKNYIENDGSKRRVGIDVSQFQGYINWETVAGQIDFAIVRIGYRGYVAGNLTMDPFYHNNMQGAIQNGVDVGVYFYSQATSYEEGVEEANFVLNNLGEYALNYPIVIDIEDPLDDEARTAHMTSYEHTEACIGFLDTVEAAGHKGMIYTNRNYYALNLIIEMLYEKGYPIWFAQYASMPDWPHPFHIWQYSEAGRISGIETTVDLNLEMITP